jgi:tripartite-type tricarboxylate transporter receptor subunit TctC
MRAFTTSQASSSLRDIVPVAGIMRVPLVMVVHLSFPATTVPEFIAYAKSNPGKINMGSAGNGSSPHAAGELFKMMAGVNLVHIPYRGASAAITDLTGGAVAGDIRNHASGDRHIRAGQLGALAVTTATRSEALPDAPTVASFVPGYEASASYGIGAPKDTPAEIIRRLNTEINAGLAAPKMKARFAELGGAVLPGARG